MPLTDPIALSAKAEMPEDYAALEESSNFGDPLLTMKLNLVMQQLFGEVLDIAEQGALDRRVLDYAGKLFALELINPATSYWKNQAVQHSATGRNETKTYVNRAESLKELRKSLLASTRSIFPDIGVLLPGRTINRRANVPAVRNVTTGVTANPDDFEPAFAPPSETATG